LRLREAVTNAQLGEEVAFASKLWLWRLKKKNVTQSVFKKCVGGLESCKKGSDLSEAEGCWASSCLEFVHAPQHSSSVLWGSLGTREGDFRQKREKGIKTLLLGGGETSDNGREEQLLKKKKCRLGEFKGGAKRF